MSSTLSFFFLLAVISTGLCSPRIRKRDTQDDASWSGLVYALVQDLSREVLKEVPRMEMENLTDTFGGKLLDGRLRATGGSIGDFSTLNLVNLSVTTTPDSITVFILVKLDRLEISYTSFEVSLRGVPILQSGGSLTPGEGSEESGFRAVVGRNLLTAQVTLDLAEGCKAVLDILELTDFGSIDLAIPGVDSGSEGLMKRIVKVLVSKYTQEMKPRAERKIRGLVLPYVSQACVYLA